MGFRLDYLKQPCQQDAKNYSSNFTSNFPARNEIMDPFLNGMPNNHYNPVMLSSLVQQPHYQSQTYNQQFSSTSLLPGHGIGPSTIAGLPIGPNQRECQTCGFIQLEI